MKKRDDRRMGCTKNSGITWGIGTLILWLAGVCFALSYWAFGVFGEVDFATIIFHLKAPLEGTNMDPFFEAVPQVATASLVFAFLGFCLPEIVIQIDVLNGGFIK